MGPFGSIRIKRKGIGVKMNREFIRSGNSKGRGNRWRSFIVVCSLLTSMFMSVMGTGIVSLAAGTDKTYGSVDRTESVRLVSSPGMTIPLGTVYDTSGVAELDSAKERTDSLIKWVCAWVGGIIALVSLIIALVMASSHQQEQRNQALVGLAVGIIIAFAPQVVNYLLGNQ